MHAAYFIRAPSTLLTQRCFVTWSPRKNGCSWRGGNISSIAAAAGGPAGGVDASAVDVSSNSSAGLAATTAAYHALPSTQRTQVDIYLDQLLEWNQHMNLTAVKDRQEAIQRHVCDSLALLPIIDNCLEVQHSAGSRAAQATSNREQQQQPIQLIDVGTGAGLPGIILAIARPEWEVWLLDSLQKRCKFLEHAASVAGLANVHVHWARAEDAGQDPELRHRFDIAMARAVADTRLLAEYCLPLVRVGGHWVAAKGPNPKEEVHMAANAIGQLGGARAEVVEVDSWSADGRRTAVVVQKAKATPARLPRKPGVPAKRPL